MEKPNQTSQTSLEELEKSAQEHYDKVSSIANNWTSSIPRAIEFYWGARKAHKNNNLFEYIIQFTKEW